MRKNVKQQLALRVLSTAALMAMVSSIATAAFADTYDLNKGSVDILAEDGKQYITQWENESKGTYATDDKGEIKKRPDDDIILTTKNKDTGETKTTSNTVTIDAKEDNTANVTLQDVHIETERSWDNSGSAPIEIKGDGDTNLELNGNNTVLSGSSKHAGIEKADVNGTGTLTIKDDLNDNGKEKSGTDATGTLVAGGCYSGAGIGGGGYHDGKSYNDTSNITITGGDITAIGGGDGGSGIGGGGRPGGAGKNICIEGNAHVTAAGSEGAAIGGGASGGNSITIKDHAVVNAFGTYGSAIGDGGMYTSNKNLPTTITISGNATVYAETSEGGCAIGSGQKGNAGDLTINIEENANVTAISAYDRPAIGNYFCYDGSTTTINITGGTVNAINSFGYNSDPSYDGTDNHSPAIGGKIYKSDSDGDHTATCNVNINSSTGDTIVNAYIYGKGSGTAIGSMICTDTYNDITHRYDSVYQYVPADGTSYHADGSSNFGESNSAIVNCYNNGTVAKETLRLPGTKDPYVPEDHEYRHTITGGTLTKVVHNRTYMDENPNIDTTKLKDEDLHDWKLVGEVVKPTTEKDGYADYICSIDKCGQTKHVVLPKIVPDTPSTPETPDTPDTPNTPSTPDTPDTPSTPSTPDTPSTPVTPDAPVQDAVPDTAPADAAVIPAAAQNVVQDAKPEAAATAAVSAAALPQTGANWLAVVGSALSGLFLLAAGFVLDRKGRRMN
jgi:LPXTG-motif cell wall-anchored protein